ncbi:MAG: hypothetical protein ACHQT5_01990 [Candidatus Saccharimonadales bacterium]
MTNSRLQKQSNHVWRRRQCLSCGAVFTSIESVDYPKSFALEMPNKALRPFVKERLLLSIIKCCEHRKNSLDDAIALTNTTTAKVMHSGTQSVITAHELTKIVHNTLSKFDTVSAMQYAALHPEYKL